MADKPGCLFVFTLSQMLVVPAKLPDELLQLLALGVLLHLHNPTVGAIKVRVPPEKTFIRYFLGTICSSRACMSLSSWRSCSLCWYLGKGTEQTPWYNGHIFVKAKNLLIRSRLNYDLASTHTFLFKGTSLKSRDLWWKKMASNWSIGFKFLKGWHNLILVLTLYYLSSVAKHRVSGQRLS